MSVVVAPRQPAERAPRSVALLQQDIPCLPAFCQGGLRKDRWADPGKAPGRLRVHGTELAGYIGMLMSADLPAAPDEQHREAAPLPAVQDERLSYASLPVPGDEEQATDYRRMLAAVLRYKWLVAVFTVLGIGVGYALTKIRKAEYEAHATIWVQGQEGGRAQGPIQQAELLGSSAWIDLVKSYVVLDEVVRRMHLFLEPQSPADSSALASFQLKERFRPGQYRLTVDPDRRHFLLATKSGTELQHGTVGDSVGPGVGFAWVPPATVLPAGRNIVFTVSTPRDAAVRLGNDLRALIPEQGTFLTLRLSGTNPGLTAATLNAVAQRFVEVAAQLKTEKLAELTRILGEQLQQSEADLRRAETALEGYRVGTITLPADPATPIAPGLEQTRDPVYSSFFAMKVDREQLRRDREAIERVLALPADSGDLVIGLQTVASARNAPELMAALNDLTQKEAELRALRNRYTNDYPPVQRLAADVTVLRRQTAPALAHSLVDELRARELELDGRIGSASRDLRQIPARAIEEARRRRDVTVAENLYTNLQQRYAEAHLAEVSSIPDVRVLDAAATPEEPTGRNVVPLLFLGGVAGGIGLAVILAILLDRVDRRIRYPDQVTKDMGLTILGVVPRINTGNGKLDSDDATQVVEALRNIRLNVVHAYGAAGPLIMTITSPGPGDGKSFISSNLALSFAEMGHRTLLIDGDIRRGTLHRVLTLNRKPGLLDYLSGHATREQIVQETRTSSLEFIGSGTRKSGGPGLLASATMSRLMTSLRSAYSVIIVDSPPLGAGVDPLVLGTLTGSLMLVLRTGVTDRELAGVKLDHLNRLPIRILGAILNDVRPDAVYRYYYSSYYLAGYESKDEGKEPAAAGVKRIGGG